MKKILSLILALTMILSLAACGTSDEPVDENDAPATGEIEENVGNENAEGETDDQPAADPNEQPAEDNQPAADPNEQPAEDKPVENKPAETPEQKPEQSAPATGDTVASQLKTAFEGMAANSSALDIATALSTHEVIKFGAGAMPVEPGLLSGFDNYEVTGFQEGAVFMPMIGSIAFVGYVFTLEDGADVNAFMENLKANCNPRWNICVEAEETLVSNVGNKVFFVMSPMTLEG